MSKLKSVISSVMCVIICLGLFAGWSSSSEIAATTATSNQTSTVEDSSAYVYEQTDDVVEITFWTSAIETVNQELVDQFNETAGSEQNIHVTAEYQGDYWEMQQKINAASVAGTLPNVFIDEVAMSRGFAEDDVILDLEPYIEAHDFDSSEFGIGDLGNLYVGGDMYAFPHMRSVPVMYVNKTLAAKAGLSEDGPSTFAELESYLQTCYDLTGETPMYLFNYDFWVMEALLHSYADTDILNDDETSCNINSEGAVKLITFLENLESKSLIKVLEITNFDAYYATFINPNTALMFSSIGGYKTFSSMASQYGIELGVSMIPTGEDGTRGVPVGGSNTYLANTGNDEQKAAAFEFMMWLSDTEQSAYASANTGYLPTKLAALDTDLMQETIAEYPGYTVAFDELEYCEMRPTAGAYHEIEDVLCSTINSILLDNLDIKENLDSLAEEVNEILNR